MEIPVIENIHQKVYEAAKQEDALFMGTWHCDTSHCRAGWIIHLAGPSGYALEHSLGTADAALKIYEASSQIPIDLDDINVSFYDFEHEALADMKRLADLEREHNAAIAKV